MKSFRAGFTILEVVVLMGIAATLLGLATVNLLGAQRSASLTSVIDTLIADIKQQQVKAMVGDTSGSGTQVSYGLYIGTDRYTLFVGSSYTPGDPDNFVVSIDPAVALTTAFPTSLIVFTPGSGEIVSYTAGSDTITARNALNNEQKTMRINRYGVITSLE